MALGMGAATLELVLAVLAGAFAQWLSPYAFRATHVRERLLPPFGFDGGTTKYVLGTDNLGRDILSRLLHATQISIARHLAQAASRAST
jgi:peptide/nickel transport system permease protein